MLQTFMETSIGRVRTTLQALHLLDRFSRLNIKKLGIDEKYRQLFLQFGADVEAVKHVYALATISLSPSGRICRGAPVTAESGTSCQSSWA